MQDYDQVLDPELDEEHMASLYDELDTYNRRLEWKTFITWMATTAAVPVALGFQFDQEWVDNLATIALVGVLATNVGSLLAYLIGLHRARQRHRRWHDANPDVDHDLND